MLELEILVLEFRPVDAFPARAITFGEVAALDHELLDHTVESRALVSVAFFSRRESTEVLGRLYLPISSGLPRIDLSVSLAQDLPLARSCHTVL